MMTFADTYIILLDQFLGSEKKLTPFQVASYNTLQSEKNREKTRNNTRIMGCPIFAKLPILSNFD